MESQLSNYSLTADNKGILSLLSAIEQSEDNFDPDSSPSKMIDKDSLSVADNFSNLQSHLSLDSLEMAGDIHLANFSVCVICGRNPAMEEAPNDGMIDIFTEINIPGDKSCTVHSVLEDVLPSLRLLETDPRAQPSLACLECYAVVDGIAKLRAQVNEYIALLRLKHDEFSRVTSNKPTGTKFPSVSDFSSCVLELKMPLNIFNVKDEELPPTTTSSRSGGTGGGGSEAKKSKLQILAETIEGSEQHSPTATAIVATVGTCTNSTTPVEDESVIVAELSDEIDEQLSSLNKENEVNQRHRRPPPSVVTGGATNICDNCGDVFNAGSSSRKRAAVGGGGMKQLLQLCNICTKEMRLKASQQQQAGKQHCCLHCDKKFKTKASLNEHTQLKHLGQTKCYSCNECGHTFPSKHMKTVHERSAHKGNRSLVCDECGVGFQTFQSLQYHRSKHTGDFSYHCQYCNKGFNNFKLMEEHSHIHTGDKPYVCQVCDKSFANRGSLWLHVKKHETKKPYVCDYCHKSFGHSSHLVVHKRMHTGERPYSCRFCQEGFISGNHLKRHMKGHQNELPFACGICKQEFGKRTDLVKHGNTMHNGNVVDDIVIATATTAIGIVDQRDDSPGQLNGAAISTHIDGLDQPESPDGIVGQTTVAIPTTTALNLVTGTDHGEDSSMPTSSTPPLQSTTTAVIEKEYTTILVDSGERLLLNKLTGDSVDEAGDVVATATGGPGGEYVLPVSLLEEMEDGSSKQIGEQTIVFIQVPQPTVIHHQFTNATTDCDDSEAELHNEQ